MPSSPAHAAAVHDPFAASVPADAERFALRPTQVPESDDEDTMTPAEHEEAEAALLAALSRSDVCHALATAAQTHDLPPHFMVRLIWQESRFNPRAVSPVGAQGVAQFMPKTAAEFGLEDPFDVEQALEASARYLDQLRRQFGNLGLAAAAYNAGPGRLRGWLEKRGGLPKETRHYVQTITGRTAENWVVEDSPTLDSALPRRAPCSHLAPENDELGLMAASADQIVTDEVPPVLQRARAAALEPKPDPVPDAKIRTASADKDTAARPTKTRARNGKRAGRKAVASSGSRKATTKAAAKTAKVRVVKSASGKRMRIALDVRK